jgi:hypothetical protein
MILITTSLKRMSKARKSLPHVECTEAEARVYMAGFWNGIALGAICVVAVAVLAAKELGIL